MVTFDQPGTTRGSIFISHVRERWQTLHADRYRRRAAARKISETVEKFSVIKTLQAIEQIW